MDWILTYVALKENQMGAECKKTLMQMLKVTFGPFISSHPLQKKKKKGEKHRWRTSGDKKGKKKRKLWDGGAIIRATSHESLTTRPHHHLHPPLPVVSPNTWTGLLPLVEQQHSTTVVSYLLLQSSSSSSSPPFFWIFLFFLLVCMKGNRVRFFLSLF